MSRNFNRSLWISILIIYGCWLHSHLQVTEATLTTKKRKHSSHPDKNSYSLKAFVSHEPLPFSPSSDENILLDGGNEVTARSDPIAGNYHHKLQKITHFDTVEKQPLSVVPQVDRQQTGDQLEKDIFSDFNFEDVLNFKPDDGDFLEYLSEDHPSSATAPLHVPDLPLPDIFFESTILGNEGQEEGAPQSLTKQSNRVQNTSPSSSSPQSPFTPLSLAVHSPFGKETLIDQKITQGTMSQSQNSLSSQSKASMKNKSKQKKKLESDEDTDPDFTMKSSRQKSRLIKHGASTRASSKVSPTTHEIPSKTAFGGPNKFVSLVSACQKFKKSKKLWESLESIFATKAVYDACQFQPEALPNLKSLVILDESITVGKDYDEHNFYDTFQIHKDGRPTDAPLDLELNKLIRQWSLLRAAYPHVQTLEVLDSRDGGVLHHLLMDRTIEDRATKVQEVLNSGLVDINRKDRFDNTPLHFCMVPDLYGMFLTTTTFKKQWATLCVDMFLKKGSNYEIFNSYGLSPVHYASALYYQEPLKLILAKGADINFQKKSILNTLGRDNRADLNHISIQSPTPLICGIMGIAAFTMGKDTLHYNPLLFGVITNRHHKKLTDRKMASLIFDQNVAGESAFYLLVTLGADASLSYRGENALLWSLHKKKADRIFAEILLDFLKDDSILRVRSEDGRSPLEIAKSKEFKKVVELIKKYLSNDSTQLGKGTLSSLKSEQHEVKEKVMKKASLSESVQKAKSSLPTKKKVSKAKKKSQDNGDKDDQLLIMEPTAPVLNNEAVPYVHSSEDFSLEEKQFLIDFLDSFERQNYASQPTESQKVAEQQATSDVHESLLDIPLPNEMHDHEEENDLSLLLKDDYDLRNFKEDSEWFNGLF